MHVFRRIKRPPEAHSWQPERAVSATLLADAFHLVPIGSPSPLSRLDNGRKLPGWRLPADVGRGFPWVSATALPSGTSHRIRASCACPSRRRHADLRPSRGSTPSVDYGIAFSF